MQDNDGDFSIRFKKRHALAAMVIALLLIGEEGRYLIAKLVRSFFP